MRHGIWVYPNVPYIVKSKNTNLKSNRILALILLVSIPFLESCISYSFTGASTLAETIQVDDFFNNTDLGPANLGQTFTNRLKEYFQQNSSLRVTKENGELQIEGTLTQYAVTPVAPVSGAASNRLGDPAALTRLTIAVRVNYVDTKEPKNSFKDKTFSFYQDFPSAQDLGSVQESLERKIFDQIFIDIFNATIANW
ncbi:MAG: LptE family protein [Cyclobacteriaceae bacterium]|nr:LptE family protein [Cyclobacteriaceae bacterium]